MIRKVISKLPDSASVGRTMNYALNKAELVSGSETKFDGTSIKNYNKLGVKKFNQINNKFEAATGRKQEVVAVHEVISFSPKDNLTNEQALEIAMSVWKVALNLDNRKYRVAVHDKDDNGKTHVHLIWNSRDNKGKPFEKNGDYELFEKLCHQAELKHGLEEVKNRKYLNPKMPTNPQAPNEYRLENRGIKSEKTKFKEAVNASTDKAMTASEFLEFLDADGFTLITNGNNAYSLEKEGQIFKASEIGASYKLLKARFGDDPAFSDTLARLGVKTAPIRKMGSIGGDFHDQQSAIIERRAKKSNRVVDTRFDTPDGHDFFFKNSTKKAFEYDPVAGRADFNTNSPMAIKAGLQKLTETGKPQTLHLNGTETFKRQAWLQFHMMNLDKKGYSLSGFKPSSLDKAELEKMKNENPAFKKPIQENNIKALPTEKVAEKPKDAESKDAASTIANGAVKIAASVLDGAIDKITDMSDGNAKDVLAAMHMLEEQIERSNREKQKTRKATFKNKLTPQ